MSSGPDNTATGENVYCAHCGTANARDAYSCDRCGERIYLPDPLKPPPMGLTECQNCLTANESRASYCVKCGESLADAARISVLGSGLTNRQAPRSQPGGIRMSHRERADDTPPETQRPRADASESQPARSPEVRRTETRGRVREPDRESAQRRAARERAAEQERRRAQESEAINDSGTRSARLPSSAKGWNTAAFLIGPIWGPANGVWLGLVGLLFLVIPGSVPSLGQWGIKFTLYLAFGAYLGIRGNEMAWRARRWPSLAHFRQVQQRWMLVSLVVNLILLFTIPMIVNG